MNLTELTFRKSRIFIFASLAVIIAGIGVYLDYPSQEEPTIPIREAVAYALYPGMSTRQMEDLVARPMEERIRELAEVKKIETRVRTGMVLITARLHDRYTHLQPIWQRLRAKMRDAQTVLPPGTQGPYVDDDYGRVAVASIAFTAPGFTWREIRDNVKQFRDRLYSLPDVDRITIHGLDDEVIFLETDNAALARTGLSPARLLADLQQQNIILPGGEIESGGILASVAPTGNYRTEEDIRRTPITLSDGRVARLGDLVNVRRGLSDPPRIGAFFDGAPAVVLAVSMAPGRNVFSFGRSLKERVALLEQELPLGFKLDFVTFQADVVEKEINNVKRVLAETLVVVMAIVVLFVGLRTGVIVGAIIPLTLLMSLLFMRWAGIELHTVSLAALIISLGLLVDNGIVIAEDILRRLAAGEERTQACIAAGRTLAVPLLTSTLACIAAFMPLMLAQTVTGEYTRYLSYVIAITLMSSWVLSLTLTPLLCHRFARVDPAHQHKDDNAAYRTPFYRIFRRVIEWVLGHRALYAAGMVLLFALSILAAGFIPQSFLPNSARMQLQISIELSPGNSSKETMAGVKRLAQWLSNRAVNPEIVNHIAYVGEGGPRVVLALNPPDPAQHTAYAILNIEKKADIDKVLARLRQRLASDFPEMRAIARRFSFGMHDAGTVIYRIGGLDLDTLRRLSAQIRQAMSAIPGTLDVQDDWESDIGRFEVVVDQEKARQSGVTSEDIAASLQMIYGARAVSGFREGDRTLPVVWRAPAGERNAMDRLWTAMVFPANGDTPTPLSQIARIDYAAEPSIVRRYNLARTVSVSGRNPHMSSYELVAALKPVLDKLALPPQYEIEIGGEIEENTEANNSLFQYLPLALILLLGVFVAQFNSMRKVAIIAAGVPFCFIGVVAGMLTLGADFNFMAMLGILALAGIIVSNAVLLLERIEAERRVDRTRDEAIVIASLKRLRPILMTKLTCVGGLVPLLLFGGPLWHGLAVVIIGGLSLGTLVTLGLVPVLYSCLFGEAESVTLVSSDSKTASVQR